MQLAAVCCFWKYYRIDAVVEGLENDYSLNFIVLIVLILLLNTLSVLLSVSHHVYSTMFGFKLSGMFLVAVTIFTVCCSVTGQMDKAPGCGGSGKS